MITEIDECILSNYSENKNKIFSNKMAFSNIIVDINRKYNNNINMKIFGNKVTTVPIMERSRFDIDNKSYHSPNYLFKLDKSQMYSNSIINYLDTTEKTKNKIIAILPAYNEEISICSMVLHTRKYVDQVIVIDDGSTDRTAVFAEMAGAEIIRHIKNLGKGAALKTGFEAAIQKDVDIIVTIDADGQHDPADIPRLIQPVLTNEADMVNGSRYIGGKNNNTTTPFYRRIGQTILDKVTNFNSGLKITDTQSGFRAFSINAVPFFRFKSKGMAIESEMLADAAMAKLRIKETEIGVRYDVDCSTENPVSHGLQVLVKVLHDMELKKPLYYFSLPGVSLITVGMAMGLNFLRGFYFGENLMFGPSLLMILLTLVGIFMTFTGIILHSMARIIQQ